MKSGRSDSGQASQMATPESVCGRSLQMIDYKKLAGASTAIEPESELPAHRSNQGRAWRIRWCAGIGWRGLFGIDGPFETNIECSRKAGSVENRETWVDQLREHTQTHSANVPQHRLALLCRRRDNAPWHAARLDPERLSKVEGIK